MKSVLSVFLFMFACLPAFLSAQDTEQVPLKPMSSYFPGERAKVLVVGTFHFDYPGLDAMKEAEEDKIDVLKEPKKSEVTELVEYLKRFQPTKIAIEAHPEWKSGRKFREYRQGKHRDNRDERYQLGMRIGLEMDLDTIYPVDAYDFTRDLSGLDSAFVQELFRDYDFRNDSDPYSQLYRDWFTDDSKLVSRVHLLEYFKHMNSRESHEYGYGAYLIGDFKLGEYRGADLLAVSWYDRNLRIFRNIQRITESNDDRILVVIGNGHAAILRQLFEMSPEFEFVELDGL